MTVETTTSRVSYTGAGTTGPFAVPFYFLEDNDLAVIKVTIATGAETALTLTTDYTVSGAGDDAGGSVTLVAALSSAYKLVIVRDPDLLQSTSYPRNDPFPAATHERVADKLTMLIQRLSDLTGRSFRLSDGDTSGVGLELSSLAANSVISVNAAGDALEGRDIADIDAVLVTAFAKTLLDDADAPTFLSTLGISAFAKTLLDDADAAAALSTLGLSAFVKTLVDDADASAFLSTLGVSAFAKTILDDADAATVRATIGAVGASEPYIYIRDEKAANTAGGTFTAGAWQTRDLNTEVSDAGGHASVATNQITLAAGTYRFSARAPAFKVARHKARLQNITDGTTIAIGSNAYNDLTYPSDSDSLVRGRFTIAAPKVVELQHYGQTTCATNGFGSENNFGVTEVYSEIEFWKEY